MPDIDLIVSLSPMVAFWAAVLWASALIAPKTKGKTDQ